MAFFDDVIGFIFGGDDDSAQRAQEEANAEARRSIDISTRQAREDVLGLFPEADINRNLSFQAALDVLGRSIPQQLETFQAGNVGAQRNLLSGLPLRRAAILGGQVDLSTLQPSTIGFDPSFTQQRIPDFITQAAPRTEQQQQQDAQQSLARLLAGAGNFNQGGEAPNGSGPSGTLGAADAFDLSRTVSDFLSTPLGKVVLAAIPGGSLGLLAGQLSEQTIADALGAERSGVFGTEASEAVRALGLTSEDFAVGGVFQPNVNEIVTRDIDRFGPPRIDREGNVISNVTTIGFDREGLPVNVSGTSGGGPGGGFGSTPFSPGDFGRGGIGIV